MSRRPPHPSLVEESPAPPLRSLSASDVVAAAVAALMPRDGGHFERLLEVARDACGADMALALRRIDAVTVFELASTPHPRLPPLEETLFRGMLGSTGCHFFEPGQDAEHLPAAFQGATAVVPWASIEERQGAILFVRADNRSFSPPERAILHALAGLLVTTVRECDLERATATLRVRVDAITHALPCALVFLDQNHAEAWVNGPGAELLGLSEGQVPPHQVALAMAALREHTLNREEIDAQLSRLFRGGSNEIRDILWRFQNPDRVLSVSCVRAYVGPARGRLWVFLDVTESQHTLASLEEKNLALDAARREADAANAAKSLFLANMSHEIRTPMNGVLGVARLLKETPLTEQQREYAELIHTSGDALLTIINDILDFSKIEAGALELEHHPFSPRQLLDECRSLLSLQASAKGLYLRHEVDPQAPVSLLGDRARLRQILVNLLGNAIKFTRTGGVRLHVSCEQEPAGEPPPAVRLRFTVQDTGIGIPADRMDRLFRSFSQVDASTSRHYGGTGLGLAISQKLAGLMGGSIEVESTEGQGSTFTLRLSLHRALEPAGKPHHELDPTLGTRNPLRILLVEDNPINQKVSVHLFQRLGYQVQVVGNGREALSVLESTPYDVVFMDLHMPHMDGLKTTEMVRANEPQYGRPRIVAMTASAMRGDRERCMRAGMNDYVTKPVEMATLATALERAYAIKVGEHSTQPSEPLPQAEEPVPEEPSSSVFDPEAVGKLMSLVNGDRDELASLTRSFLSNAQRHLKGMREALSERQAETLAEHAHSLRSSSALFGATGLSRLCAELERIAPEGLSEPLKQGVELAERAYTEARQALENVVPECRGPR
ncbi:hybrid sensor histidine kinase/response regulator [Hyalangium versicolor]|uniref:hybrid sensor histidine kinase/response regulator n=1 Tax=Hyalangium versicolor TaxID=2861190 RepID=UPI001CCA845E|nr:ATP-binding protein [Hyalangium versicolor]